ncbi:MAG: iron ABC transporter permease [Betaproteobacteria bacterium]|nr:iron ABC transporter permease [Betaproteobacteria bacterium]
MRLIGLFTALLCAALGLPVLGVLGSWVGADAQAWATLAHQWDTVLPGYALTSGLLLVAVALGVTFLGAGAAAAVTLFDFPGRRVFEWALLLPLAMPAYVMAYAYTDALQFSGPVQTALRSVLGLQGALWPDVRSLGAAIILFTLALYPYVYLLTRTALAERGVQMMEAARLLGAGFWRRVVEVALPLARPAIAAGVALALMETVADYGVSAFFGLDTLATGIYKAWLAMNDRWAAAQLASMLLAMVALLLWIERRAQARLRFASTRQGPTSSQDARPLALRGGLSVLAVALCALPVMLGFGVPVVLLLRLLWQELMFSDWGLPLGNFGHWAWASFRLALSAGLLTTGLALLLAFLQRANRRSVQGPWDRGLQLGLAGGAQVMGLGYAVPGGVIAVGILLPLAWVQAAVPQWGMPALFTGTVLGLMLAYLVRFSAVALQAVEAGYSRVPAAVDDTARLLGARAFRVLRELHLPLLRRSALAALLLVFVDVMKELPATLVLRPFNTDTLAVVAFNLARDERLGEAALPSLAIVLVGLIPVVLLSRALRTDSAQAPN